MLDISKRFLHTLDMDINMKLRRELMAERDKALAVRDIPKFQELTTRLAALPMKGVPPLTAASIKKWNSR